MTMETETLVVRRLSRQFRLLQLPQDPKMGRHVRQRNLPHFFIPIQFQKIFALSLEPKPKF